MSGPPPAPGDRPRGGEWGWRAAAEEQGVSLRPGKDDLGPQLLRVQGPLQGPEVKGPGDVPARLAIQGEMAFLCFAADWNWVILAVYILYILAP